MEPAKSGSSAIAAIASICRQAGTYVTRASSSVTEIIESPTWEALSNAAHVRQRRVFLSWPDTRAVEDRKVRLHGYEGLLDKQLREPTAAGSW